ncbi:MAG: hypothetical protein CNIPEHKO_00013 [Anaerolineales bacterium]|nr:hypothetical protein [Anaerolineales bacterium]
MASRELILSEIDNLNSKELDELYKVIRQMNLEKRKSKKKGALARIRKVKISGPKDFSVNHDLYIAGKRRG